MCDEPCSRVPMPWYLHPYFAAVLAAGAVLTSTFILTRLDSTGPLRVAAALLAVPPSAFGVWTFVRWIRGLDELEHRIVSQAVSFAFVASILGMIALQGLDRAGVVTGVTWETGWAGMLFLYVAGYLWARRRYA